MVWMLWIALWHCQQWWEMYCLQDSVYLFLLSLLSDHCAVIVQSTTKCFGEQNTNLPYKSNFWIITKTVAMRKNFQQFCAISCRFFSVFFSSARISGYVALFLVASGRKKETPKNPDFELSCTILYCHFSHTRMISVIFQQKMGSTQLPWNERC